MSYINYVDITFTVRDQTWTLSSILCDHLVCIVINRFIMFLKRRLKKPKEETDRNQVSWCFKEDICCLFCYSVYFRSCCSSLMAFKTLSKFC